MVKVLITGVCGQIGSQLARQCLKENWEVVGIDNLSTGTMENIKDIENKISFYRLDLTKMEYFKEENFDYVFHLGALADIVPSIENPKEYFDSNVRGTFELMEYCRKIKPKKVIYSASSSCYGIPKEYPTPESSNINCEYPYSFTKWQGEEIIKHYQKVYNINYISLRLFNVYSPYAVPSNNYGAVIKVFAKQLLENEPLTIIGNGSQTRDFIHVKDVCRAFILSAKTETVNEEINIGADNPITINHLASRFFQDKKHNTEHLPWRKGEPKITHADIAKAKLYLNWSPEISIKDGIGEVLKNLKNYKTAKLWTGEEILKKQKVWNNYLAKEK